MGYSLENKVDKNIDQAVIRKQQLREGLKQYREEHGISLDYVSKETLLRTTDIERIEAGYDLNIVHYLLYARALGLSLYLQPWEE